MKVKVTFPTDCVEFDVKDIPDLLRLCEGAKCFREDGYGRSKYRVYSQEPITIELPVTPKEPEPEPAPAPPPAAPTPTAEDEVAF